MSKKVFVSGCYDILHGGHVQFFEQAKALGDHLTVCFAGDASLKKHKRPRPSLPQEHKQNLIAALRMVDEVVIGDDLEAPHGLDFRQHFLRIKPQLLVVTEDDKYESVKKDLCAQVGAQYVVLPKTLEYEKISTSDIVDRLKAPYSCPLRVDFAGGWLDVPRLSRPNAYIVNCAISPLVTLDSWPYNTGAGLGGSAAHALLNGKCGVASELDLGVGWQDPAVISQTGLCVWRSGNRPELDFKTQGDFLRGRLALLWTGRSHTTYEFTDMKRDLSLIEAAGVAARQAVMPGQESVEKLADAINMSYKVQLDEGMQALESHGALAQKYCGGGFGGYALYLFKTPEERTSFVQSQGSGKDQALAVEPWCQV
ncbi:cytidyltransferase-related domain-containing protein [Dunaliella salina]|uniref:Cytidyltransferase-related domain-containing protein n=1 Tax=Dunaliella salina TaxID=3046 RepID=A0ABQ7GVI6_DUNSA|nr:cytidyltransferase-related domain-containing protein [Dunaliella salina]|eukprot:KAF5838627.1 cytidyltransferase-related domain-containing protein [Dunaliella salina]